MFYILLARLFEIIITTSACNKLSCVTFFNLLATVVNRIEYKKRKTVISNRVIILGGRFLKLYNLNYFWI